MTVEQADEKAETKAASPVGARLALGLLVVLYGGLPFENRTAPANTPRACRLYNQLKAERPGPLSPVIGSELTQKVNDVAATNGFAIGQCGTRQIAAAPPPEAPATVSAAPKATAAKTAASSSPPPQTVTRPAPKEERVQQVPPPSAFAPPAPPAPLAVPLAPPRAPAPTQVSCAPARVMDSPPYISPPRPEYPSMALSQRVSGNVDLYCSVGEWGRLTDCSIVSEAPAGWGFGQSARSAALNARVPRSLGPYDNGCPRTYARLRIEFRPR